jgi:hypothetical protein
MNCKAKTAAGKACRMAATKGGKYCFTHSPATRAAQAEARKRGGYNSATPHYASAVIMPANVATLEEANAALKYVWDETIGMENSIARNRLLLACYEQFIKSIEVGELEARIQALEARQK